MRLNHRTVIITTLLTLDAICIGLALSAGLGDPLNLRALPVGDGKVSDAPKIGYVYGCQGGPGAILGGAFRDGPWIKSDGSFDLTAKVVVDGNVLWKDHRFAVTRADFTASSPVSRVTGNGLPDHATGTFPVASSDDAYRYDRNPNRIRAQTLDWALPATPTVAARPSCLGGGAIGVLLTGSVIYNALDAGGRDAVAHEVQDACQGHPDPSGTYHYHALTSCLEGATNTPSKLIGYALDGFGIYGPRDETGKLLTNADLDECHGRSSQVLWNGKPVVMYHYVATYEYPYTLGCFRGVPISGSRGR
jgi:YHYH protein